MLGVGKNAFKMTFNRSGFKVKYYFLLVKNVFNIKYFIKLLCYKINDKRGLRIML